MIGDMLRDLPDDLKLKWFNNWDRIFAEDNPRYQSDKFYAYVNPRVSEAAEDLARELRR
jgi:hypothetical protein